MSDKLPPLPPGATLKPVDLPPLPKNAALRPPEEETPYDITTGMPIYGYPQSSNVPQPTGAGKMAEQLMAGLVNMPLRYTLTAAKPLLGAAQLYSQMAGQSTSPTQPSLPDQAINAVNLIEEGTNQVAGPMSYATTRPAGFAGNFNPMSVGLGNALSASMSKLAPNIPRLANAGAGVLGGTTLSMYEPTETGLLPEEFADVKKKQMMFGAGVGGALGTVFGGAASKDIQKLRDAGVTNLTPGMLSDTMSGVEKFSQRFLPFISGAVRQRENEALQSFNKGAANTVLQPLGKEVPPGMQPGYELNQHVKKTMGQAYDNIAPKISLPYTQAVEQDIGQQIRSLGQGMSRKAAKVFRKEVDDAINNAVTGNVIQGTSFRELESNLGSKAMDYVSSKDAVDKSVGRGIFAIQNHLRKLLKDSNPSVAKELTQIHTAFKNSLPFSKAAKSAEATNGVITPGMLRRTTKNLEGLNVPMRDFADSAVNVMGKKVVSPNASGYGRAIGLGAEVAPFAGAQLPMVAEHMFPGSEYVLPMFTAGMRGLYSKPGVGVANLAQQTPGGTYGTIAGQGAGALADYKNFLDKQNVGPEE